MLQRIKRFYLILHFVIILSVCTIVLLTKYSSNHSDLLRTFSAEGGFFEWGSFWVSLTLAGFALYNYFQDRHQKIFGKIRRYLLMFIAVGAILIAMEEISWGQRILGFESGDFFTAHNAQKETNLHNLISGEYLNLAIYSIIYIFFIFLPLLVYFRPALLGNSISFRKGTDIYMPSIHNILMFCFGSSLQAYFLPRTAADTTFLWLSVLLVMALLISKKSYRDGFHLLHFSLVLTACIIFAISYDVFEYNNMQYEIREFVVSYAFLYWCFNWTNNLKAAHGQSK